jgi:uroporphyrinogen decarboxylase
VDSPIAHPFLRACRRQPAEYTPVWLMRQAGRYLPEYRTMRARLSLLDLCKTPEAAAAVTVLPVEKLGVDAAIIFADILLVTEPMGLGLAFVRGEGPMIHRPLRTPEDVTRLPDIDPDESVPFVFDSVRLAKRELRGRVPLIGFAGAPFTVASYLIEGGPSREFLETKRLMYTEPQTWRALMEKLARLTSRYLNGQIAAGADAVQLFDSWVGCLSPDAYRRFVLPYTHGVIASLAPRAPVIHFGTGTAGLLELMREAGGDVIGLDWRVDLGEAWQRLGDGVAVQGNLDPALLLTTVDEIRQGVRRVLAAAAGRPGHIFNLGHGVLPQTPWENVAAMVDAVHEMSRRAPAETGHDGPRRHADRPGGDLRAR